ncbi:Regulatory protein SWI6 [Lasiodiplodia hormozganensis]|uniref:Transcription factor SWI6 n=1 Tax=Lasiodiplodia hormozganensis TaxID=869390 RepID=A0AA39U3J4_9PEZI|nr:Regulatory protein SWI6 [Lasiodiplodia hormozganensis]
MQVAPSGMAGFEGRASSFTPTQPQAHRSLYGDSGPPQQNGFARSFPEGNGLSQHHMDHPPQIYTAVYSNVNVYEMEINGIAVMKRRSDSWLNATQILKVAGVDKGKRTKVLEKEILTGEHEKVQGGYGKYQGTWINYRRGREFCRQYGVEDLLRPLLDYGVDGGSQGHEVDTPTKEQAMAANRKRFYASTMDGRTQSAAAGGTFFSNISSTASNAIAAMNKVARMNSPAPRPGSAQRRHMASTPSRPGFGSQESFRGESQQSVPGLRSERSFSANGGDSTYATQTQVDGPIDGVEPPRKRLRQEESFAQRNGDGELIRDGSPTEPSESFVYHQALHHLSTVDGDVPAALPPLPGPADPSSQEKQAALLDLFQDNQSRTDYSNHPAIVHLSGTDLDMPLDQSANTALHWAATLARVSIMRLLISKGANIFRGNAAGQTPLMAAVAVNNCLDHSCFPELLELLAPLIEVRDDSGRTILHHIAVASGVKGRAASSKYYLEALLEFLVRSNTGQSSQSSFEGSTSKPIGLMRFMSEMVNARDVAGNTALNLVARIGNRSIIQQLLEVKADPSIPNYKGLRPLDFGVGEDPERNGQQTLSQVGSPSKGRGPASRVEEASREMMPAMSSFLSQTESQFNAEIRLKQDLIDRTNASIQSLSTQQRHLSNLLASLQRRQRLHAERSQRITNLKNAIKDQRSRLARSGAISVEQAMSASKDSIRVGDADSVSPVQSKLGQLRDMSPDSANSVDLNALSSSQHSSLVSLPSANTLRAALSAYDSNNAELRARAAGLRERNGELEAQYRKVVCLCTGVAEDQVEVLLGSLVKAVESEVGDGVEVGRVREFLRKVDFVEN